MRLPEPNESVELPTAIDAALEMVERELTRNPHGYVRAWTPKGQRFLFCLQGKVHSAGALAGDDFVAASITETIQELRSMDRAVFCPTDVALLLCLAVPFRKAPNAQVPANLVDPHMLLESVRKTGTDAVIVVRRGDARSVAFCRNGEPEALYAAVDEEFPEEGTLADCIVAYVFSESAESVTLDIYDEIRLPPSKGAGEPLASYLSVEVQALADPKTLVVKLGDRTVFHFPMTQEEVIVGRSPEEAELTLDNLSVSRRHARFRWSGQSMVVEDLGGKNGIVHGGRKVERVTLSSGQSVGIGKYTIEFLDQAPSAEAPTRRRSLDQMAGIQETMMMEPESGWVIRYGGKDYNLRMVLSIGSTDAANIVVKGWWIAPVHVQIVRDEEGKYLAMHLNGRRAMKVNGQKQKRARLKPGDTIKVGRNELHVLRAE